MSNTTNKTDCNCHCHKENIPHDETGCIGSCSHCAAKKGVRVLGRIVKPKEFKRTQEYHGTIKTEREKHSWLIHDIFHAVAEYENMNCEEREEKMKDYIVLIEDKAYKQGVTDALERSVKRLESRQEDRHIDWQEIKIIDEIIDIIKEKE